MTVNTDPLHRIFRSVIAELINCESDSRVVSKALILATKDALRVEIQTLVERILKVNDEQTREFQRWITESINFDDPHRVDSQHELDDVRAELVGKVKHLAAYAYSFLVEHELFPITESTEEKTGHAIANVICEEFFLRLSSNEDGFERFNAVLMSLLERSVQNIIQSVKKEQQSKEGEFEDDSDIPF